MAIYSIPTPTLGGLSGPSPPPRVYLELPPYRRRAPPTHHRHLRRPPTPSLSFAFKSILFLEETVSSVLMQKNQYKTLKLSKILTIIQPPKLSCAGWWHGLKAERCDSDLEFLKIQVFSLQGLSPGLSSVNTLCSVWLYLSCSGYILVVSKGVCNVNIGHRGGSVL